MYMWQLSRIFSQVLSYNHSLLRRGDSIDMLMSICPSNGLCPIGHQGITWTTDEQNIVECNFYSYLDIKEKPLVIYQ